MEKQETTATRPVDLNQIYKDTMRQNLVRLMTDRAMTQGQLLNQLKKQGVDVAQGSLSQYLSGNKNIPLSVIVHLCDIFQVSLAELVGADFDGTKQSPARMPEIFSNDLLNLDPSLGDSFITDPGFPEFHGYLQTYYFYMLPTRSYKTGVLTGTLTLRACGNVCEAHMDLDTGKPLCKHYSGPVIIAKAIDAVYILLTSPVEGDLSVISFGHYHMSHQSLDCRIAAVLTNESGEFHSPTMHRMLLSRTPIQQEHLPVVLPHLQFNNSSVTIPKDNLDRLLRNEPEYAQLFGALTMMIPPSETYYWSEDYVVGIAKHFLSKEQIPLFLARIREIANHCSFNKASRRANYLIQNLLKSMGYFEDPEL